MTDFYGRGRPVKGDKGEGDPPEACVVLRPFRKNEPQNRSPEAALEEARGLATAIGLEVAWSRVVPLARPKPGTLLGTGAIEDVAAHLPHDPAECPVVIVDALLSPVQQRNLEKAWARKVIDRTGLILEIFGDRARTKEGRLQVELAALNYQLGRLVRSWTHLERQRGGAGFMGGPGETQIEVDRRLLRQRITRLKRELTEVKRTRGLQRRARKRVPFPAVALVGYTNAGKSTLFNHLTGASVMAEDQLFATLDPTMRRLDLPHDGTVVLSDTVGFVSDLPHELVEAFHATLEEVLEADVILHVRDIAHEDSDAQRADVISVLASLGVDAENGTNVIEVLNKIDSLDGEAKTSLVNRIERENRDIVALSAVTGEGTESLLELIRERVSGDKVVVDLDLAHHDGRVLAWIYDHGEVLSREDGAEGIHLKVKLSAQGEQELQRRLGR